jgi:hypothetical protein
VKDDDTTAMPKQYRRASVAIVLIGVGVLWASRQINSRLPDSPRAIIDPALAPPPRVSAIIHQHCADCHSEATRWPWYAHLPPISWLIERDVNHARAVLNFSRPLIGRADAGSAASILAAMCNAVNSGGMPPRRYRLLHPNSALNADDRTQLCQWTKAETLRLQKVAATAARSSGQP